MTPQEKLAASLAKLEELQRSGRRVFRSRELGRVHRERLVQQGFLREIMRGWLLATSPDADPGDTTPWYASFWEFCAAYCNERFGDRWHLSPEQSLLLLAENTVIPDQLVVHAPQGTNNNVELLFGSSLYDLKRPALPPEGDLVRRRELLLYGTVPALLKVPPPFFRRHPIEAEVVLTGLDRPSELISRLLDGGHTVIAGRLAGALRRVGRRDIAQEIIDAMRSAGYDVREADPFADAGTVTPLQTPAAPIAGRLQALWHSSRGPILRAFSDTPKPRLDAKTYLRRVDEVYESDAYHSLSIEGYVVTPELIERVRAGDWQPDERDADRKSRDALAARGYWEAFQLVKESVRQILAGESAAELIREAHPTLVSGAVSAERTSRLDPRVGPGRLPQRRRVHPRLAPRTATTGSGPRGHVGPLRLARRGKRARRTCGAGALADRVHPPLPRRQRPHGALRDERDAGIRRLSVDRDPG
jgi:hypothetical protein